MSGEIVGLRDSDAHFATPGPARAEPPGFGDFWRRTLEEHPPRPVYEASVRESWMPGVEVRDVAFAGYGAQPVRAWLMTPRERARTHTRIVQFVGHNRGRGYPHQLLALAATGHPVLVMDNRGQGGEGDFPGATPDNADTLGPDVPGFVTRGIQSPETSYLRRLYVDGIRAVDAAIELVPAQRTVVYGRSLGGAVGLAVAGMRTDVDLLCVDAPSLAQLRESVAGAEVGSRAQIQRYLAAHPDGVAEAFATLEHFDVVHFATRARARAVFGAGLQDRICPPATVFAAYHHYAGEKKMYAWPFNGHESGGGAQLEHVMRAIADDPATIPEESA